jgi:hypothetical protein
VTEPTWIEAATLGPDVAHETWALAARQILGQLAGDYHAVVTVPELADQVQQRSRIRTRSMPGSWMGDVLYRVAHDCQAQGAPLLNSLCVQTSGAMGPWYADTVLTVRGDRVDDPEQHAARERLECYRYHGAQLPPDGGVPALPHTRRPERARATSRPTGTARASTPGGTGTGSRRTTQAREKKVTKKEPRPAAVCPSCFMALPASGRCDFCD